MSMNIPENLVPAVNRMVRTSRQMLCELGRQPDAAELAARLAMPLDKMAKLLSIAPPARGLVVS